MTWQLLIVAASLILLTQPAIAQKDSWHLRGAAAYARADGSFHTQRANGKFVTSDIDDGIVFNLRAERRISSRVGVTVGGLGLSRHRFIIHQDFPDGTTFEASDDFLFQAVTTGAAIHFLRERRAQFLLEPFLLFAWFDDVSVASSGNMFDRETPIDVDIQPQLDVGLIASFEFSVAKSLSVGPWVGLSAVRFTGPFPADPALPDSEGDIDVDFSPVMAGVAMTYHFGRD